MKKIIKEKMREVKSFVYRNASTIICIEMVAIAVLYAYGGYTYADKKHVNKLQKMFNENEDFKKLYFETLCNVQQKTNNINTSL